jgi:hypothetical protein
MILANQPGALRAMVVIAMSLLLVGCGSPAEHAQKRRLELLEIYPPGITHRSDVHKKWASVVPDVAETRPEGGWAAVARQDVREQVVASEKRTGKSVSSCERYWGPDPTSFLGLEYVWFFYDDGDTITDVEWQYHTD